MLYKRIKVVTRNELLSPNEKTALIDSENVRKSRKIHKKNAENARKIGKKRLEATKMRK